MQGISGVQHSVQSRNLFSCPPPAVSQVGQPGIDAGLDAGKSAGDSSSAVSDGCGGGSDPVVSK